MISPVSLLASGLEVAFNKYLQMDPEAMPKLAAVSGRVVAVTLSGMNITLFIQLNPRSVSFLPSHEGLIDVSVRATPGALMRLAGGSNAVDPELEIKGNTEVARVFQAALSAVDIDWEEHLSQLIGDTAAHQAGNFFRISVNWGRQAFGTWLQDIAEYLQQENTNLPPRGAVEHFLDSVDELRSDLDRLEARVQRLQRSRCGTGS